MIYTVSIARLDRYKIGKRQYISPLISDEDFQLIKNCTALALKLK